MKIKLIISALLIYFFHLQICIAQTTNFVWVKTLGAAGTDNSGTSIATDASGNVYTTGNFQGTVDFDPGAGTSYLTSAGGNDAFISKSDAAGNLIWAKRIGGTAAEFSTSIALDATGNVYTIGYFYGTTDFDPGIGTYNLATAGGSDIYVSKLDADGLFVWAKAFNGVNIDLGASIAIDANGYIYTTGYFFGTVDFDPSATTFNLSSSGGTDIFITKLDSTGNFVWAKKMGGTGGDSGSDISIDASGNIYTTGYFAGTADFDPSATTYNVTSVGAGDIFISKLDANGNFVWAKGIGSANGDSGNSIAVDDFGNVYTTGNFRDVADFDPSGGVYNLTSFGGIDVFVTKFSGTGNMLWAKSMGGTAGDIANALSTDGSGNVYITGYYSATADFDPAATTFNLTASFIDIFISKLSTTGNFIWAKSIGGGSNSDYGNGITTNSIGSVYTTGSFQGTADFDEETGTYNVTAAGNSDIFIHKMAQCNVSLTTTQTNVSCFGGNNGTATASLTGGYSPLSYLWQHSNDGGLTWTNLTGQTTATATGLSGGSSEIYSITITDQIGCMATLPVTITQPANSLAITTSQVNVTCFGGNNGQASVTVTGITNPPYSSSWSTIPEETSSTANNLTAGTYTVTVTDASSCTATEIVTITQPPVLSASSSGNTTICAGQGSSLNTTITGGIGSYTYNWLPNINLNCATCLPVTASPVSTTTYTLTVSDSNNCSATTTTMVTVNQKPTMTSTASTSMCSGETVSIPLTSSLTSTYTWVADDHANTIGESLSSQSSNTLSNTIINNSNAPQVVTYFVTPTSTVGNCVGTTQTVSVTVNPNPTINTLSNITSCPNQTVTSTSFSSNVAGTSFAWTNNNTSIGLAASGSGSVPSFSATNATSSPKTATITVTPTSPASCNGSPSTYTIIINPNANIALSSAAGTNAQTVCINNAIASITYTITGGGTGAIASGLPAGVTGSFSGGEFTISGTPTVSGTFIYTVSTSGNCTQTTATGTITVNPDAGIALSSAAGTNAQTICIGNAITTVTYTISGGGTSASATGLPAGVSGSFTGGIFTISGTPLVSGTYNYTVTTTGTCTQTSASGTIIINAIPSTPTASSNSPVNAGSSLSLNANSIFGATYNWTGPNGFSSTLQNPSISNITAAGDGSYSVTATVDGCTSLPGSTNVTVITMSITTTQTNVSCYQGNDGAAAVLTVSGGTEPYTYSWSTSPAQTSQAIFGISSGTYTVTVTDFAGYSATASITITEPAAIAIILGGQVNVSCNGGNNGTVHAIAGGGTGPYSYSWNTYPTQNSSTATNLSAGTYMVTVTDANGCTGTNTTIITQPSVLAVSMSTVNSDCGSTNGSATATITGGTPGYSYQWSNSQTTQAISGLASGTYSLAVTDSKGCILNTTATIGIIPSNFNLAFSASPQAGAAPFTATFSNTTSNLNNYNFTWYWGDGNTVVDNNATVFYTYNFAGTYDVALIATNITNGCQDTLAKHPYINVSGTGCGHTATISPAGTINKCLGDTVILNAGTSASAPFTYQWNIGSIIIGGATGNALAVTQSGYYSVTILKNNCPVTSSAVLVNFYSLPPAPTISASGTIVPCVGGSMTLTASGISGASYSWNTNPVQNTQSIIVNASGNYIVTATTGAGCQSVSDPYLVNASYAEVPLCMVTVDSLSTHNIVYWNKTGYDFIDSFKIYREVTTNTFAHIGTVAYDSLSEYHDYGADPNVTSYTYKLTSIDSCGNESSFSDYHTSIHLQNLGGGNLQWTLYEIENASNPVSYYRINRDDNNTGNFAPISSTIPGGNSTYTDVNYNAYPNANYRVDVAWSISCTPTRASVNTTRSNIKHQGIVTNLANVEKFVSEISIYPNPSNSKIILSSEKTLGIIFIYNTLGELVMQSSSKNTVEEIDISKLRTGIYYVNAAGSFKKFVKE